MREDNTNRTATGGKRSSNSSVARWDSLLDLLARFIHLQSEGKRDDMGRKVKNESMIFPRYHQLQAVRTLVTAARSEGVVQRIEESSRQLAEALENAVPIIITTLQKFSFVSRQLIKIAEDRGVAGTGSLPTRRCAVIIDEAHSSQGGETATDLKEVLGGAGLREEAKKWGILPFPLPSRRFEAGQAPACAASR